MLNTGRTSSRLSATQSSSEEATAHPADRLTSTNRHSCRLSALLSRQRRLRAMSSHPFRSPTRLGYPAAARAMVSEQGEAVSDVSQGPNHGRQSSRTPLTAGLRRLFALHESAASRGLPVDAVLEELERRTAASRPLSRRKFLTGAAVAGAGLAIGPTAVSAMAAARPASSGRQPR